VIDGKRLAADHQLTDVIEYLWLLVNHGVEQCRIQPQRVDAVFAQGAAESVERGQPVRQHDASTSVQQRRPDFKRRSIERGRGHVQNRLRRIQLHAVESEDQTHDSAVRDGHALRAAGRPGGIHHVGKIVRPDEVSGVLSVFPANGVAVTVQTDDVVFRNG